MLTEVSGPTGASQRVHEVNTIFVIILRPVCFTELILMLTEQKSRWVKLPAIAVSKGKEQTLK